MNVLKYILLTSLILLSNSIISAQEWSSFKSPEQVNDLADNGEELFLASNAGLVVLNKATLEKSIFNASETSLPSDHIQSVALSSTGSTFIGTYDVVLARFDGSDFVDIEVPEGISNANTRKLYDIEVADNGDLWVATSQGVFRKQGDSWTRYAEPELGDLFFEVWDIEIDQSGNVYAGAQNGVLKFENGSWTNISEGTSLQPYLDSELYFSQNGDLFIAADLDSIARYDGENWELYGMPIGTIHEVRFTEDAEGTVYINNTPNSILKLEGNSWIPHTNDQTILYGGQVAYYYIDNQDIQWLNHNIYLSSNENGNIQSTSISPTSIEYNKIYSIEKDINGNMYFLMITSTNSIAVHSPDGEWSYFDLPTNDPSWAFWNSDILYRAADDIWISSHEGLYHFDGSEWSFDQLGSCKWIVEDSNGRVYVASVDRIYIVENGQVSEYNESNSQLNALETISAFGMDAYDNIWIGSFSWDNEYSIQTVSSSGVWTSYDGVDHEAIKRPYGDFHFDINGNVWVPSDLAGVIKFDGQEFTNPIVEHINDLSNYNAFAVESDAEGRLYFSHQYGITTLLDGEWEEWFIDEVPNVNSSIESTIRFDDAGVLWWGSVGHGLFAFTPEISTNTSHNIQDLESSLWVYPNPAVGFTSVVFSIEAAAEVDLLVFNKLGQQMDQVALGYLNKGSYEIDLELSNYPAGMYIVQLRLGEHRSITKLIID